MSVYPKVQHIIFLFLNFKNFGGHGPLAPLTLPPADCIRILVIKIFENTTRILNLKTYSNTSKNIIVIVI